MSNFMKNYKCVPHMITKVSRVNNLGNIKVSTKLCSKSIEIFHRLSENFDHLVAQEEKSGVTKASHRDIDSVTKQ